MRNDSPIKYSLNKIRRAKLPRGFFWLSSGVQRSIHGTGTEKDYPLRIVDLRGSVTCREWSKEEIEIENERGEIRRAIWGK